MVREAQCSAGDSVICTAYCGAVFQNILLSGRALNKLFIFGEFVAEVAFVKVPKNNN